MATLSVSLTSFQTLKIFSSFFLPHVVAQLETPGPFVTNITGREQLTVEMPRNGATFTLPSLPDVVQSFSIQHLNSINRGPTMPTNPPSYGGVVEGLRSAVRRATAPISSQGCNPASCVIAIPVNRSCTLLLYISLTYIRVGSRCFLLAPETSKHGLPYNNYRHETPTHTSFCSHLSSILTA